MRAIMPQTPPVHAVLAVPPGVNVGMAATELGLLSVVREVGLTIVPRRHPALLARRATLPDAAEVDRRMDVGVGHTVPLDRLPAMNEGRLLYWADFHHMRQYVTAVAQADGGDGPRTRRLLMADGADDEIVAKAQSFGTTLLFNGAADLRDAPYCGALERLLRGCAAAWFRDPISAAMARRSADGAATVRLGVDAALLAERPPVDTEDAALAVFLGRTAHAHAPLLHVAERLSQHLGLEPHWLDWGCHYAFPALPDETLRRRLGAPPKGLDAREALRQLSSARAVVTDSYHLALIAWAWGIPAVTITGIAEEATPSSVDGGRLRSWRDKREIAASHYGALEFVLRPEEWTNPSRLERRLAHLIEMIDGEFAQDVANRIAAEVAHTRAELLASWRDPNEPSAVRAAPVFSSARREIGAAAVVAVRNERRHVDGLLRRLVGDGLDVVVIDHASTDGSGEIAKRWQGHGVLWVEQRPFDGVFRLEEQLQWKEEAYAKLDHEWLVHVDADEWLQPPRDGERLIDLIQRADASGANVVNFDEFTFVPDIELPAGADPREVFTTYYHFAPSSPRLMRMWRQSAGLSGIPSGGHILLGSDIHIFGETGILRHYPVLSADAQGIKYLDRVFSEEEVRRGWHGNRIGLRAEDFAIRESPSLRHLVRWSSRDFDRSAPVRFHYWQKEWTEEDPADSRLER
jgi:glycosyltransferase involved in cell wall biosynthesis